jgi:hypothetical protein
MGSFSWTCACGCSEITPTYNGKYKGECARCDTILLEGQPVVVLMPDSHDVYGDCYGDYGNIEQDGKTVLELYAWLAKANLPEYNEHEPDTPEFWEATRAWKDCDEDKDEEKARIAGIHLKEEDIKYPIKIVWEECHHSPYHNEGTSDSAPNQGFGNVHETDCCGMKVCEDCTRMCCEW